MWKGILKFVAVLVLFIWLLNYANTAFADVFTNLFLASPRLIALSVLSFLIHILLTMLAWHYSLRLFNVNCPLSQTAPLFAFSTLTKYIPGGIWHAGSRVFLLGSKSYSKLSVLYSVVYETILSIVVATALASILFAFVKIPVLPFNLLSFPPMIYLAVGFSLFAFLAIPSVFQETYNIVHKLAFRQRFENPESTESSDPDQCSDPPQTDDKRTPANMNTRALIQLQLLHAASLLIFIVAYYFCFRAYIGDLALTVEFAFAVLLATVSGFIVLFAPAGLGVRESMLYVVSSQFITDPLLLSICLAPRLVLLVSEVIFFAVNRLFIACLATFKLVDAQQ